MMMKPPKTRTEAEMIRYGEWAGNPNGRAFDPQRCAYEQHTIGALFAQCGSKPGKGPGGLYCGTHANKITRDEARRAAWKVGAFAAGALLATAAAAQQSPAPNPQFTPGEVVSTDREAACAFGHTPRPYETDPEMYDEIAHYVFELYGISYSEHRQYELDHLVPRCIGGADTVKNLWPQPCYVWGKFECLVGPAADKDQKEHSICRDVCHGRQATPIIAGQRFFIEGRWRAQ